MCQTQGKLGSCKIQNGFINRINNKNVVNHRPLDKIAKIKKSKKG